MRKIRRLRHANFCVCGDEQLLGALDVGPSLDQRRRQSRGNVRRARLLGQRPTPRHPGGQLAEQDADEVLLLLDQPLERGNLAGGGVDELLGLTHVEHRGGPASLADSW